MITDIIKDIFEDVFVRRSESKMREDFSSRRAAGKLSLAHDETHVMAVAKYAGVIAYALAEAVGRDEAFRRRVAYLTVVAGLWHDMCRKGTEKEKHGPDGSAMFMNNHATMGFRGCHHELTAVAEAVRLHEGPLSQKLKEFGDPVKMNPRYDILIVRSIVGMSVKIADGCLEASGYRVVERRCFFAGRERMIGPDADITMLKHPEESDLAIIGESIIRLYKKLAIDEYPVWLRPLGEELHAVQYWFLSGLLFNWGLIETSVARELLKLGFPKLDDAIVSKVENEQHLNGRHFKPDEYPVLAAEIKKIKSLSGTEKTYLQVASSTVVGCITIEDTPEEGIKALENACAEMGADNLFLKRFRNGITGYRNAGEEFMESLHQQILDGVKQASAPA